MFASKDALIANAGGGYPINNSLRFRSSASAYLNRTFSTPTNNKIWTYSIWVKRGVLGAEQELLNASTVNAQFSFLSGDTLYFYDGTSGASYTTTQVFRDPSSWYHLLVAQDTTQATAGNRVKIYVNGVQITSFSTGIAPTQNNASAFNATSTIHNIGRYVNGGTIVNYFDGYMAEVNFIDGQALTPSSFGAYDATTGVWQPALYTGTYGTNGFYLKFASFGTTAALGTDSSGNGNTWTVNNISVTAGTTYDPMLDSPTLTSATVANYAVLNPLNSTASSGMANANLRFNGVSGNYSSAYSTMSLDMKCYWEQPIIAADTGGGISYDPSAGQGIDPGYTAATWMIQQSGILFNNSTNLGTFTSFTTNDVLMFAFDPATYKLWIGKNGTWMNSGNPAAGTGQVATATSGKIYYALVGDYQGVGLAAVAVNFGQQGFSYTPPTGFVALNAYNLPTPTIANGATVMAATTFVSQGATPQTVVNTGNTPGATNGYSNNPAGAVFTPDLVWTKPRSITGSNVLNNSVAGASKYLVSDTTAAEVTNAQYITSFNSNGFSVGTSGWTSGSTMIGWQWLAGAGSSSSNTAGSITSTVSVNATAGFSVVTYTGNNVAGATVGHGLGVAPSMMIFKPRSNGTDGWAVYHTSIGNGGALYLETTGAVITSSLFWNNTTPTSSVFSIGTANRTNGSGYSMLAYCWSAVAGYSAFGSYTGNGSTDGTFVYTGFRPRYIMLKRTDAVSDWSVQDSSRDPYNISQNVLYPNLSNAEAAWPAGTGVDLLSNGFKLRNTGSGDNASGGTYIYAAFAENPFKYALAR